VDNEDREDKDGACLSRYNGEDMGDGEGRQSCWYSMVMQVPGCKIRHADVRTG
jgi:hypothetical protein